MDKNLGELQSRVGLAILAFFFPHYEMAFLGVSEPLYPETTAKF